VVRHPPDIAIEIVSRSPNDRRRDRVQKHLEYARFGVHFYWLLDPEARSLEILELGTDGKYTHALAADAGAVPVPGCPGLVLDLDALWGELERLGPPEA
jgi:Uma2 family endonuclease